MKPTDQETELRAALRPWTDRAARLIERRLDDARAHAADGQIPTATRRLTELARVLSQTVSDARASFYRQAFQQHTRAGLDPDVHRFGLGPDHEGELAARSAPILGRVYGNELLDVIADAQAAMTSAALADQGGALGGGFLPNWAVQYRDRLIGLAAGHLSSGQISIFHAVGQILIRPELR